MCHPIQRKTASPKFRFANRLVAPVLACGLTLLFAGFALAGSATWELNPTSGDWNTAANWTPTSVPNGPADVATFGLSNTTRVSISADTEVDSIILSQAATNPYIITVADGFTLTLSGLGIVNNSGSLNHALVTASSGQIRFTNSSTAGNMFISGTTNFFDTSTAGNGQFGDGTTNFFDRSTAGTSFFSVDTVNFFDRSTAGNGIFQDPITNFFDHSSPGGARFDFISGGIISFFDHSTAGNERIDLRSLDGGAIVRFADSSSAGSATITLSPGGDIAEVSFQGSSQGGTAQIQFFESFPGAPPLILDISSHNAPGVTIGSIEGEGGNVFLGANNLTVGSSSLSTAFSGVIQDGGRGTGGSLTKIGSGTLILSGANTYTGNTNINRGVLQVDGSTTSNTFVNPRGTLAGIGTIQGDVTNAGGTVSPGDPLGSLTVIGNYTQQASGTLLINIAGLGADQFSLLNVLGTAELDGVLNPILLNGFIPAVGDSFTFLNYDSVSGSLFIRDRNIDNVMEHWLVTYFPDHAVLSVAAGKVSVPDQASTLLLMTLSLLALVGFKASLRRS